MRGTVSWKEYIPFFQQDYFLLKKFDSPWEQYFLKKAVLQQHGKYFQSVIPPIYGSSCHNSSNSRHQSSKSFWLKFSSWTARQCFWCFDSVICDMTSTAKEQCTLETFPLSSNAASILELKICLAQSRLVRSDQGRMSCICSISDRIGFVAVFTTFLFASI